MGCKGEAEIRNHDMDHTQQEKEVNMKHSPSLRHCSRIDWS